MKTRMARVKESSSRADGIISSMRQAKHARVKSLPRTRPTTPFGDTPSPREPSEKPIWTNERARTPLRERAYRRGGGAVPQVEAVQPIPWSQWGLA